MEIISASVKPETAEKLREKKEELGIPISVEVRKALRKHLEED